MHPAMQTPKIFADSLAGQEALDTELGKQNSKPIRRQKCGTLQTRRQRHHSEADVPPEQALWVNSRRLKAS